MSRRIAVAGLHDGIRRVEPSMRPAAASELAGSLRLAKNGVSSASAVVFASVGCSWPYAPWERQIPDSVGNMTKGP